MHNKPMNRQLQSLTTEQRNPRTLNIDLQDSLGVVRLLNAEDKIVATAVEAAIPNIAKAVDLMVSQLKRGGRLIYVGAGTSGRLGILDASECPPTFGTSPELVTFIMAGGEQAFLRAVEGAEDDQDAGELDLQRINLRHEDVVVAISASGRTPYCIGALTYARRLGTPGIAVSCNREAKMSPFADVAIEVVVGPEAITGSTRLKAGTAQKMVLNMLSTASMVRLGKVYENLMVDMQPTNLKLQERAKAMVTTISGCSIEEAEAMLAEAGWHVKTAIVALLTASSVNEARKLLDDADGFVRRAVQQ